MSIVEISELFSGEDWTTIRISRLVASAFSERDNGPLYVEVTVGVHNAYSKPFITGQIMFKDDAGEYDEQHGSFYASHYSHSKDEYIIWVEFEKASRRFEEGSEYEDFLEYLAAKIDAYGAQVEAWRKDPDNG